MIILDIPIIIFYYKESKIMAYCSMKNIFLLLILGEIPAGAREAKGRMAESSARG